MSLDQLIIDCKNENAAAQEQLYHRYASKLFSLCLKYSRNYAEAEDDLQDSFLIIFEKIGQYKGKGSFEGWLKRITINNSLQKYRSAGVYDLVNEDALEDDTEVEIETDDISLDYLLKIIQELPERYRLVFSLYVLDGYSHNEISNLLKISIGTSKSNLARARMILKTKIEEYKATKSSQRL
ncbi:RNA polymerase sigma factor [Winogradskyella maritima]|uniref:RNA polymerase sigma factor n=1 Tax=Winogradskyella maritima TaxID=1517766 RepID=A0ABV8AFC4_9FLAO|nr:RNA polymerase sigma factor [Winogradskyella maritima]